MDGIHEPIWYVGIAGLGFLGFLVTFSTGNCINWAQRSDKARFPVGYKEATNDTVKGAVSENATGQWFQASALAFAIFAGILSIVPMSIGKPDGSQVRLIEGAVLVYQAVTILLEDDTTERYYKGLGAALGCLTYGLICGFRLHCMWMADREALAEQCLVAQIVSTCVAGVCYLLYPRKADTFRNGVIVDRQYSTSFVSRMSYSWVGGLIQRIKCSSTIHLRDIPELDELTQAQNLHKSFVKIEAIHQSLAATLLRSHAYALLWQLAISGISTVAALGPQIVILNLLKVLEAGSKDQVTLIGPAVWIVLLGVSITVTNSLVMWKSWLQLNVLQTRTYSQLTAVLFDNTVKGEIGSCPKGEERPDHSAISLVVTDAKKIAEFMGNCYQLWETPLHIGLTVILLTHLLEWKSVCAGLTTLSLTSLLGILAGNRLSSANCRLAAARDKKTGQITELLDCIREVKLLAVEDKWEKRINILRDAEIWHQSKVIQWKTIVESICAAEPILLSAVMLGTHVFLFGHLSPFALFTCLALLDRLQHSFDRIPHILTEVATVRLSTSKVQEYLHRPRKQNSVVLGAQIDMRNATIAWAGVNDGFHLKDMNMNFPTGKQTVVHGPTGSGKSLLLTTILGQNDILKGTVRSPYSKGLCPVAYVPQNPWVESCTFRDNILFGLPYNSSRYAEVIVACALDIDLRSLHDGDLTVLYQNGTNLSGGQKARLALARALYSNSPILLLDGVFSSVDRRTAGHLVEFALNGRLAAGRTCILAVGHVNFALRGTHCLVQLERQRMESRSAVTNLQLNGFNCPLDRSFEKACQRHQDFLADESTSPYQKSPVAEEIYTYHGRPNLEAITQFMGLCDSPLGWLLIGLFFVVAIAVTLGKVSF